MTIDEVKKHAYYRLLTPKESEFITSYVESEGDIEQAVYKAFGLEGKKAILKIRRLQMHPQVGRLLILIDGVYIPSQDEVIHELWKDVQTADNASVRVNAAELVAKMKGWIGPGKSGPETPDTSFLKELSETTKDANKP